jgi:hypothetical protein
VTSSKQSFSCTMERLELSDCWHQVSNRSAVSWRDYRVDEWLLTPSEQSFSCIMERLQSWWVIVNTKWAIVQLHHGEITELMSNRSTVSWRDYRVEWLTPSEQSFSCIMERTSYFQWDDDNVGFVQDRRTLIDKQFTGWRVSLLGHIIPIQSQPVFALILNAVGLAEKW